MFCSAMLKSPAVEMKDLSFSYGDKTILSGFNLSIQKGKTYALVGSSGSGKTTTLRLINGLLRPAHGELLINGKTFDFNQGEAWRRSMGYSIQGSGLFPHMNLRENLSIIAKKEGWNKEKINRRIHELCELMALPYTPEFLKKKPRQISGGQQQRVGIARALFMKPQIMLMDEPFSALDPITRSELQKEFMALQSKLHLTIVLVTHDLSEAFSMADEIVLLNQGRIEQKGKPSQFLLSPASSFVENFIQSHSPGNILKEIFLYSVINSNIYTALQETNQILLKNIDSNDTAIFSNEKEARKFLISKGQSALYWVDHEGKFLKSQEESLPESSNYLLSTDHILTAMKKILELHQSTLPVISEKSLFVGVFSREALNAL